MKVFLYQEALDAHIWKSVSGGSRTVFAAKTLIPQSNV